MKPIGIGLQVPRFRAVAYCAESSFAQYHTAQSQVPRSIILRGINQILLPDSVEYDTAPSQAAKFEKKVPPSMIQRGIKFRAA